MRWKVGEFEFDDGSKQLQGPDGDVVLEPKAAALLAFFCQNPQRDIDRQELLDSVWYGQVVADNSINRVIVLLRKALKDEDKVRQYISTVPKLGYRFIGSVEAIHQEQLDEHQGSVEVVQPDSNFNKWLAVLLISVAVLGFLLLSPKQESEFSKNLSVVPLSRLSVAQSNADLASDGKSLVYTANIGDTNAVFLSSEDLAEPIQISTPGSPSDYARWANNDEFVVYLFNRPSRCEFHKVFIVDNKPLPAETIYQCPQEGYTEITFSSDNSKIYFVERSNFFTPYEAFELDLNSQSKRRLSQPVTRGLGNHFLDMHPTKNKLLLLSDQSPGKTTAYELDVNNNTFELIKAFDYSLQNAVWGHDGQSIVHPSMHPSYQLLETNYSSGETQTLVSDSRRITSPRRVTKAGNQTGFLFTSYLYNRDIEMADGTDLGLNSAVMDYLPAFSQDGSQLAFISKRSGYSKIWIKNLDSDSLTSIEPPDRGRLFFELAWSPDDSKILANTNTGVLIYSLQEKNYLKPIESSYPTYAVSWHDEHSVSYSQYEQRRWQAYRYDLRTEQTQASDPHWAFSLKNAEQHILLDQQLTPYRDGIELTELAACVSPLWRYRLRYQLDRHQIYCYADGDDGNLLLFDRDMSMAFLPNTVSRYQYFSTNKEAIVRTRVDSAHSDIMQTQAAE